MFRALVVSLSILLVGVVPYGMSSAIEPDDAPESYDISMFDDDLCSCDFCSSETTPPFPECDNDSSGTDWPGNDIETIEGLGNSGACCNECSKRGKECTAYVYRADGDECSLKFAAGTPTPCETCFGQNALEKEPPKKCNAVSGKHRFGGDLTEGPITGIVQPGDCCALCEARDDCVGWLWRRDFQHCWLKGALNSFSRCATCVSGDKEV